MIISIYKFLSTNAIFILCLAMLGWAGNTIAGRLSTGEISPMLVVFLRWFIITIFLSVLLNRNITRSFFLLKGKLLWLFLMGGLGMTCFNSLFYIAAQNTSAINLGIIQGVMPAIILTGSVLFFKERVNFVKLCGLFISFFGVVIVVSKGDFQTIIDLTINLGDVVMFFALFFYAGFTLGLKYKPEINPLVLMAYFSFSALISSIPFVSMEFFFGYTQFPSNTNAWITIMYIAFVPSFLAQIFFIKGVELIGASKAGLFINILPIFAAILGVIILGERLQMYHFVSLLVVLTGVYTFMVFGDEKKKIK